MNGPYISNGIFLFLTMLGEKFYLSFCHSCLTIFLFLLFTTPSFFYDIRSTTLLQISLPIPPPPSFAVEQFGLEHNKVIDINTFG